MQTYLNEYRQFVFSGMGGTGKTTLSASWALEAVERGNNVALITIDPSKRLGAEFGMDITQDVHKQKIIGDKKLDIFLIQSQSIIKDFIHQKYSEEYYQQLQKNKLFNQVSTTLAENQSVTTIYKLSEIIKDPKFDIIVVDTPPATHTLDFFRSPQHVIKVFQDNLLAKAALEAKGLSLFSGRALFLKALNYLAGKEFVAEMELFFSALFSFQEHIVEAAKHLEALLKSKEVCYFLVTPAEDFKINESLQMLADYKSQQIHCQDIIVNRIRPAWLDIDHPITELSEANDDFAQYYRSVKSYYSQRRDLVRDKFKKYDENLNMIFLPEINYFEDNFSISMVQKILNEALK